MWQNTIACYLLAKQNSKYIVAGYLGEVQLGEFGFWSPIGFGSLNQPYIDVITNQVLTNEQSVSLRPSRMNVMGGFNTSSNPYIYGLGTFGIARYATANPVAIPIIIEPYFSGTTLKGVNILTALADSTTDYYSGLNNLRPTGTISTSNLNIGIFRYEYPDAAYTIVAEMNGSITVREAHFNYAYSIGKTLYNALQIVFGYYNSCDVVLQKFTSEPNSFPKYLTTVETLNGTFRESVDIVNPIIKIEQTELPTFNYIHIPKYKRYYFVDNIVNLRAGLWEIYCHCDVLQSFAADIQNCDAICERNEYVYNQLMVDQLLPLEQGQTTQTYLSQDYIGKAQEEGSLDRDAHFLLSGTMIGSANVLVHSENESEVVDSGE